MRSIPRSTSFDFRHFRGCFLKIHGFASTPSCSCSMVLSRLIGSTEYVQIQKKAKTTGHLTMILPGVFNSLAFSPTTTQWFLPLLAVYNHPGRKQYDSSTPQKTAVTGGFRGWGPNRWSPNHHPVTVKPAAKNRAQRSGYVNERKFYTLMQESGIEKDDLQTMFNVLDSDDSGEVHVFFFVGKSWRKRSGICVLYIFFLSRFFVFVLDWEGRGRSWGVGWLWIGSYGLLTAEGEGDVIYCTRRAEKQAT